MATPFRTEFAICPKKRESPGFVSRDFPIADRLFVVFGKNAQKLVRFLLNKFFAK